MRLSSLLATFLVFSMLQAHAKRDLASDEAVPSTEATLSPSPAQIAVSLTAAEKKKLLSDFKKAQSEEEKNLDRLEKTATKDIQAAQSSKIKEWRNQERKARRIYFDQHTSAERRTYVQDYLKRKESFEQSLKDELAASRWNFKTKRDQLKTAQKEKEEKFKAAVDQNVQPAADLWPNGTNGIR